MKLTGLSLLFLSLVIPVFGQVEESIQSSQVIDNQVWIPFQVHYAAYNAEAYNALHTDEVLRATPYGIREGKDYKRQNTELFSRPDKPQRSIEFRFEHRIHHSATAYEVGYYKVTYVRGQDTTYSYGMFHVVLRKADGRWKIAQDWDMPSVRGQKIDQQEFDRLPIWPDSGKD